MTLWFAALMGIVQGLTEFLPVSSTAHLRITPALLGMPDPGLAFTAVMQLGTLAAVVVYFAREIWRMGHGVLFDRRSPDARLALHIVLGTVPIGIFGLMLKPFVAGAGRSLWLVAAALIVVAVVMWMADRAGRQGRSLPDLRIADALVVGLAQSCALFPGVSRSGATIAAALFLGLRRDESARLSFLLSIPAIAASGLFELKDALGETAQGAGPLLLATVVAGLTGYASIAWLLRFLRTRSLAVMVVYRIALGVALVVLLATHIIPPR